MAQNMKHSFNGHRKQSAGFNQANIACFYVCRHEA